MGFEEKIYYTIVNAQKYLNPEASVLSWNTLFEILDKKVSDAGFSISSGRTVTENPYRNNSNAEHVRVDTSQQYRYESGQLLTLLRVEGF